MKYVTFYNTYSKSKLNFFKKMYCHCIPVSTSALEGSHLSEVDVNKRAFIGGFAMYVFLLLDK